MKTITLFVTFLMAYFVTSYAAILQNPDFTGSPPDAGWTLTAGAEIAPKGVYTPVYGTSGFSLAINAGELSTTATTLGAYQILPTNPGDKWTFTGYLFHSIDNALNNAAGVAKIEFSNGAVISTGDLPTTYDGAWDVFTVSGETPQGANELRFSALLRRWNVGVDGDSPTGKIWFDHFSTELVEAVPEPSTVWAIIAVAGAVFCHFLRSWMRARGASHH